MIAQSPTLQEQSLTRSREVRKDAKWKIASRTFLPSRLRVKFSLLVAVALILPGVALTGNALYIRAKAELAQILLERAWTTTLATHQPTKAWTWADTWPVARLSFPNLDRSAIVLNEAGGEALAFGPAYVAASAKPGANGTT